MKDYDIIVVGTGSVMNIVSAVLDDRPNFRVAVIDKDTPGGICLTRGCIPSKILLYPAELLREALRGEEFGIKIKVQEIDFKKIMERMRKIVGEDVEQIRKGLTSTENLDFYNERAEFVSPNVMKVGNQEIRSNLIILGLGSEPLIPPIRGLEEIQFLTSDTILELNELPSRVLIVGGGYVAAEYGHFLSAMGSQVTIVGRNTRLLPQEEPEVSEVLRWHMSTYLNVLTGYEVTEVQKRGSEIIAKIINVKTGERREIPTDKLLIAAGRRSTSHYLKPELGGVKTDQHGWIVVDEYLRTTAPNVWALGDGLGKHMFKHVANYESAVVYQNAILGRKVKVNYNAVPHAIFTYPEVASVGMKEEEAVMRFGGDLLIGFYPFEETAKGVAMNLHNSFVKVLINPKTGKIVGAHAIGPHSSILIQEIVLAMNYQGDQISLVRGSMHIHPALSEVVERAFFNLMSVSQYQEFKSQILGQEKEGSTSNQIG